MALQNRSENEGIHPLTQNQNVIDSILGILSMKNKVSPAKLFRKNIHLHVKGRSQNSFMKTLTSNGLKTYTSATKLKKYQNKALF